MIVTLPYSGDSFTLSEITFKDIFNISRWYEHGDDDKVIDYLTDKFKIKHLNCIDKFFVICKVCDLYITDSLRMSGDKDSVIEIRINTMINHLYEVSSYAKKCTINNITLYLDVPKKLFTVNDKDVFSSVIDTISIDDVDVVFHELPESDKSKILSSLPANVFSVIRSYLEEVDLNVVLFEGLKRRGIEQINVNFLGFDPVYIIRALYSEFTLETCREIIYWLSRKINSETLLASSPSDIKFYLEEHSRENKENSNNSGDLNGVV